MKKILIMIGTVISVLIVVILVNTMLHQSKQIVITENLSNQRNLNHDEINRLAELIQFKTISSDNNSISSKKEFLALHKYLEKSYPLIYENLDLEVIDDYSLFFTWKGKNTSLQPILLSGHIDVVPAEENKWTVPPFNGYVDDDYIWGRGSLDNKSIVFSILESTEELLSEGFVPERTICFAFTHDEEIGGVEGADAIKKMFETKGIRFQYILDEGGMITSGILPGISKPIAMIGTAEKGAAIVELSVSQEGGTSAVPPKQTSIEILCEAIQRLKDNQMPMRIDGATKQMLEYISPEMSFANKLLLTNLWIFDGVVKDQLSKSASMNAFLKTTTATTIINGGMKFNVLPTKANAVVNYRIIQGDSVESVIQHVKNTINDERVSVRLIGYSVEPSPVSNPKADGYKNINTVVKQIYPDVLVTPYLWTGGTNSKHFVNFADNIYRFSPILIDKSNMNSIHGIDEKISIDNLNKCKVFYKQLIIRSTK